MQAATGALAAHVVGTGFADLPPAVVWEAKRRIADVVAAGLAGSTTPVGAQVEARSVAIFSIYFRLSSLLKLKTGTRRLAQLYWMWRDDNKRCYEGRR